MTSLDEIANAVLQWQRQHPLALPLGPEAVHSVGLVALPFVRVADGEEPPPRPWWKAWQRAPHGDRAAFSETFIEGLSPAQVARFALQHGVESPAGADDWPQRRVAVDSDLAASSAGGWPYERWVATAAVEGPAGRLRVLVSLQDRRPLAVLGRRHWDRRRLLAAGLVPALLLATALWLRPSPPPPADPPVAAGAVRAASAASAAAPFVPQAPASAASAALSPASAQEIASAPLMATPASAAPSASDAGSAPPIDIRPRLGPLRNSGAARPPLGSASRPGSEGPPAAAPGTPVASAPAAVSTAASSGAAPAGAASAPPVDPERPALRPVPAGTTPFALVSPGFAKREDAEAQLARMLAHARGTVAASSRLEGDVLQTPQGWRAAVYPFASREEAALINATMVARGWKTRAVEF